MKEPRKPPGLLEGKSLCYSGALITTLNVSSLYLVLLKETTDSQDSECYRSGSIQKGNRTPIPYRTFPKLLAFWRNTSGMGIEPISPIETTTLSISKNNVRDNLSQTLPYNIQAMHNTSQELFSAILKKLGTY